MGAPSQNFILLKCERRLNHEQGQSQQDLTQYLQRWYRLEFNFSPCEDCLLAGHKACRVPDTLQGHIISDLRTSH